VRWQQQRIGWSAKLAPTPPPRAPAHVQLCGPPLGTSRKWLGGAFTASGNYLLGMPSHARHVLRLNLLTGNVDWLPGAPLHGKFKWLRGVRAADGSVYGIPACGDGVLRISPEPECEVSVIGRGAIPSGMWMWHGAQMGNDGNIYAIPANAERVLKIEPATQTVSLIGPVLQPGVKNKWYGGISGSDGSIWGMPYNASAALKIVPETGEVREVGAFPAGGWKWHGGTRSGDAIIGIPSHAEAVLKIVPGRDGRPDELTLLGGGFKGRYQWGGAVTDSDGIVWAVPSDTDCVLRIDPATNAVDRVGDVGLDRNKWQGGVFCKADGNVYAIPCDADRVLVIHTATSTISYLGKLPPQAKKFQGAATAKDGTIWSLPESCQFVLRIRPSESAQVEQVNVCHGQSDTMPSSSASAYRQQTGAMGARG
jgi:DNA-binding beta-propeller fold protein YncE